MHFNESATMLSVPIVEIEAARFASEPFAE